MHVSADVTFDREDGHVKPVILSLSGVNEYRVAFFVPDQDYSTCQYGLADEGGLCVKVLGCSFFVTCFSGLVCECIGSSSVFQQFGRCVDW